jgi:D-alanyl-D-alanine carboxypeptidase
MRVRPLIASLPVLWLAAAPATAGPTLLFDAADGRILYAEDIDDQWHPASLTKIMTAYLTFEAIKEGRLQLDQKIICSERAFQQSPSKVGLPTGAEMTVETALQALIVKSANDVAMMLAEAVSGNENEFVAKMNATARRLGMTRTTFVNPNGLPAVSQVTTARDLAKLSRAVVSEYPQYASYWSMPSMKFGKLHLASHNGLLKTFNGADGLKTGFICDSGFNVVASATRDGRRLMAVVLGAQTGSDRTIRAASLLEHGFQNYGWKELFNTDTIDSVPISPDARSIMSMRQSVVSWECGTGRRSAKVARKKSKTKAKNKAEATNGEPAKKDGDTAATDGESKKPTDDKASKTTASSKEKKVDAASSSKVATNPPSDAAAAGGKANAAKTGATAPGPKSE